jgi:hypothetical protein
MVMFTSRQELLTELHKAGFDLSETGPDRRNNHDNGPRRVLVRLRGQLIAVMPARMRPHQLQTVAVTAMKALRRQGLAADPVIDRHARRARTVEDVELPASDVTDLAALRKAALVDSLGRPRAERVALYLRYRAVFQERFGRYPDEGVIGVRSVLGRCDHCDQPQELDCLPDCRLIDPLSATEPPTTRPRGARPWSPARRKR